MGPEFRNRIHMRTTNLVSPIKIYAQKWKIDLCSMHLAALLLDRKIRTEIRTKLAKLDTILDHTAQAASLQLKSFTEIPRAFNYT